MEPIQFWSLSQQEQEQLRDDPPQCIALLQRCKTLAMALAMGAGVYEPLTPEDEQNLYEFHRVQQAHMGDVYAGTFDSLCHDAGLRHSDAGLLAGRVQTLYQEREPVRYHDEAVALIGRWLQRQEQQEI